MKQSKCRLTIATVLRLLCAMLIVLPGAEAQLKQTRRVLIINDLGIVSSPGFAEVNQAIFNSLQNSPYQIELYHESLQITLFPDEPSKRSFRESLMRKYSDRKLDVIIAAGSESLNFILDSKERFIRETPIIFCSVLGEIPPSGLHITGILGRPKPEKTLELALNLLPHTKHVVVVGGMGKFDEEWGRIAKRAFQSYESQLDFTYLTDLTMPALLERLKQLPNNTIVYHTAITEDAAGDRFIDSAQSVPLVASAANAPVFVMDDVDLRAGTVGGALVNWADDGRVAGDMAVQILNGKRPEDIPIVTSNIAYLFDWRALKRWGLKASNLPPGSVVLNRQPSLWEAYRGYVIAALLVLLAETAAILALLWQRAQKRKTQAELRESEEKFAKAFQRSPLAITLVSLVDYRFLEVNDTFERHTGWKHDEIVGRTPLEVKLWAETDQRSTFLSKLKAEGCVRSVEFLFRAKDGRTWTGLVSSEVIDLNGEPCALSLIADVTEAKRADLARRESEDRFRLVANAAPVMIWMSDPDKLRNYFNQRWLEYTGRSFEHESGNGWTQGIYPDNLESSLSTYTDSFDRRDSFEMQYRLRRHDGEYRWVLDLGVPRFNSDGSLAGYIGTCVDITERKLAEEALADIGRRLIEAHEEERVWIARELHDDINQRIALMAVELQRSEQCLHDPEGNWRQDVRRVREHLFDLGKDVQSLSHRLHSSKLELLGLVAAARSFCKELAEQHKVEIDFSHKDIPGNLPKDLSLCLFRVLQEALQNAVKHSQVKHFTVTLHARPGEIQMEVCDLGIGFAQHDTVHHRGLGLISMRERLQMVKGELSIKSELGGGTIIQAVVPLSAGDQASAAG